MNGDLTFQLSYLVIPDFIYRDSRLNGIAIKVYGFINSYSNPFFFGNENLAKMFNCSERSITEALSKLEEYGYISMQYTPKAGGGTIRLAEICESDSQKTASRTIYKDNNKKSEDTIGLTNSPEVNESFQELKKRRAERKLNKKPFSYRPVVGSNPQKFEKKLKTSAHGEGVV